MFCIFHDGCQAYQYEVVTNKFPDTTLSQKLQNTPATVDEIQWYYENDTEMFTLICLRNHYDASKIKLYLPYLPENKINGSSEDLFPLKVFADIINQLDFDSVIIQKPNSVIEALFNRVKIKCDE